jgi:hypothetical protein
MEVIDKLDNVFNKFICADKVDGKNPVNIKRPSKHKLT